MTPDTKTNEQTNVDSNGLVYKVCRGCAVCDEMERMQDRRAQGIPYPEYKYPNTNKWGY